MSSRTILVATDLSLASDEALRQAHTRAKDAHLVVLYVLPSALRSSPLFPQLNDQLATASSEVRPRFFEEVTKRVVAVTERPEESFEVLIDEGNPHVVITRVAEERKVDLVVVGSHGEHGMARLLLGSVAEQVIRHAHCPVLVARPIRMHGVVLAGTDFSDASFPALAGARDEAARLGAKVVLAHSLDLGPTSRFDLGLPMTGVPMLVPQETRDQYATLVDAELVSALDACHVVGGERRVLQGPAATALVQLAADLHAELIVVGTEGRSGLRRTLLGSVAEKVVRDAPCSVLVVRMHAAG